MALTRSLKFEVVFPGLRDQDRSVMYKRVWGVMDDLTRAANRLISYLYMVKIGSMEHPCRSDGNKIPFQSLPYSACKPKPDWLPGGRPAYVPGKDGWRASGGVISALGEFVTSRLATDFKDLLHGKKSLSTFRTLPIPVRAQEISFREDGSFELAIFAKEHKKTRVTIRPRKLDTSQKRLFAKIVSGELKAGAGKLIWSSTRKKWLFSLSWSTRDELQSSSVASSESSLEASSDSVVVTASNAVVVPVNTPPAVVAAVHLGIVNAIWLVFTKGDGSIVKKPHIISFPRRVLRAVARLTVERKERSSYNRVDIGQRSGRGVSRKLRVTDSLGHKVSGLHDAMLKQMAASAVKECLRRGATLLVMENHTNWSVEKMNLEAYDASTKAEGARIRKSYFRFHQGALRQYIRDCAERLALPTLEIDPSFTSRTCHRCGLVHKRDWFKNPPVGGEVAFGKISREIFVCSCGYSGNAEHNAGVNIARRGIEASRSA